MTTPVVEIRDLWKAYRRANEQIDVLKGVNLSVQEGDRIAVVGTSGVGKSTLLHCLGLLEVWDRGEILFSGQKTQVGTSDERARSRRESIGFVFQFHYLMAELTAIENVMLPLLLAKISKAEAAAQAAGWLKKVNLGHRLHHRPAQLSGGEQQRVAIARALVRKPKLILADEPTGNLDPKTAKEVFEILVEQCHDLRAVLIMATHNIEFAGRLQRQMTLQDGVLI